jgi:adenylosuccinate synthase
VSGPAAILVADLGFGDSGKGLCVDALARRLGARAVVRYNGGPQAGHNVVTPEGRHHTFSQFGAASFLPGAMTFLSRHTAVHPTALLAEAARLSEAGVPDALGRLRVSSRALAVTPFHQAAGRIRELLRGEARHGSCGTGAGEAVADSLSEPAEAIRMGDLPDARRLARALSRLQERKRRELLASPGPRGPGFRREMSVLEDPGAPGRWLDALRALEGRLSIVGDELLGDWLKGGSPVIFEGAQGVLLDEWMGFHPHTTWSTCTFENALSLLAEHAHAGPVERVGVLRTYLVRHGPGPFPTEDASLAASLREPHNREGPWQGPFRAGWQDLALLRYALGACGGADSLALTHLDFLDARDSWRAASGYEGIGEIPPSRGRDLERQSRLGALLERAVPIYREWPAARALEAISRETGVPVGLASRGPTHRDAEFLKPAWRA